MVKRLKTKELNKQEKIQIWEQLKVLINLNWLIFKFCLFQRLLSIAYCYSLIIIAFKAQKSILCKEFCKNLTTKEQEKQQQSYFTEMYVNFFLIFVYIA